jgi:CRISPR/Cas system-associated exonuclease Cas4 (RecB family)
LVHQHLIGIGVPELSTMVITPELRLWWRNYLGARPTDLPPWQYPEVRVSAPLRHSRLVAQYDLVAMEPSGRVVIVDWKTSRRRPSSTWLKERLQTRVYPYLWVRTEALGYGEGSAQPEQVAMLYWFANFPDRVERFEYTRDAYQADHDYLNRLVGEIEERFAAVDEDQLLPRDAAERSCRFCRYRSFCQRGLEAGPLDEMVGEITAEDPFELEFDFEQIAEFEYG